MNHSTFFTLPSDISSHSVYHPLSTLSSQIYSRHQHIHTCLSYLTTQHSSHSFSFSLPLYFFQFLSHILVSKPFYSFIAHCFYFSFHLLHQPYATIFTCLSCLSFHFLHQPYDHHEHTTETNPLFTLNYFISLSHCNILLSLFLNTHGGTVQYSF